jgi:hypothetical protein
MDSKMAATKSYSRKHHFVPEFMLSPWATNWNRQRLLLAYSWNPHSNKLQGKRRGIGSVCFQLDLLTLHGRNVAPDLIEIEQFGEIDSRGAVARDVLLARSVAALTNEQRRDFAKLVVSLVIRRPQFISEVRSKGAWVADQMDSDPSALAITSLLGTTDPPSKFLERRTGELLEDRLLMRINTASYSHKVIDRLIDASWGLLRVESSGETLVLSDRPLLTVRSYNDPNAEWILPLSPTTAFVAFNNPTSLRQVGEMSTRRLAKAMNMQSAQRAERFVFSVNPAHERWLGKYLRPH